MRIATNHYKGKKYSATNGNAAVLSFGLSYYLK